MLAVSTTAAPPARRLGTSGRCRRGGLQAHHPVAKTKLVDFRTRSTA